MTRQASGYQAVLASPSWACTGSFSPVTAPQTSVPYLGRRAHATQLPSPSIDLLSPLTSFCPPVTLCPVLELWLAWTKSIILAVFPCLRLEQDYTSMWYNLSISRLRNRLGWDPTSLQPNWQVHVPSVHTARSNVTPSSATALVGLKGDNSQGKCGGTG